MQKPKLKLASIHMERGTWKFIIDGGSQQLPKLQHQAHVRSPIAQTHVHAWKRLQNI